MYTKDEFHKALEQKLGDDAYLLLAAGGHKKLADLLTNASLGASGNSTTLSITVGGTTKSNSITVPYASKAGVWETARTLTIGSAGKSVDGHENVTWSLDEIGVYSKTAADDRYVNVTGDTMTGNLTFNYVAGTTQASMVRFINSSGSLAAYLAYNENSYGNYIELYDPNIQRGIYIGSSGQMNAAQPYYNADGLKKMWHEGNDGSGSGLDADLLDGQHGSYYATASSLGNYLPLSGGTMTGGNISWSSDSHGIYFYGSCGIEKWSGYGPSLVAEGNNLDFWIRNGTDRSKNAKIIHSNNIGSQSVSYATDAGNADTIDGYHYNNLPYHPWFKDSSLDANSAGVGWHDVANSITNAAHSNHSSLIYVNNVGTPYQLQIPDSTVLYIYKRWNSGGTWSAWNKINAGYADSAGSVAWGNVTGKPGAVGSVSVPVYWTGSGFESCIVSFGNSSYGEHNANNITDNGIKYYTSNGPSGLGEQSTDGALYSQAYSTSWVAQIAQDYRNGGLYVRGKNNGTWQSWYAVLDGRNWTNIVDGRYLRKDTNDSTPYQYSFTKTNDHAIQVGTIRGRSVSSQSGEYIHLYERVHIGSPSGWGSRNAPTYGLSTYGGAWLATDTGNVGIGTTSPSVKFEVNNTARILHRLNIGYNVGDWDANRAQLELITEANDANDFWLGTNSARRWDFSVRSSSESYVLRLYNQDLTNTVTIQQDGTILFSTGFKFIPSSDIPENSGNLASYANTHATTFYRNGLLIPYQMDNANDGGFLRVRGTSESNCIFELGTWDDYGGGETIQFNYYPTTSTVTPTYSLYVPKASGHLLYASNGTIAGFRNEGTSNRTYYWGFNGGSAETYAVHYTNMQVGYASSAGSVAWGNVTGKPSTFTPSLHSHDYLPLTGGTLAANNSWLSPARLQLLRSNSTAYTDRACIGVTDGNLHIDSYPSHDIYLNYYSGNATVHIGSYTAIHSGNIGSQSVNYANSAGNADTVDGYHYNNLPYLPISGGTMTGTPYINMPASAASISDSQPFGITYGKVQCYGTMYIAADTDGSQSEYVILTAGYGMSTATKANGLAVGYNTLTWKDNTILHSGNWSSYISATISKTTSLSGTTYVVGTSSNQSTFSTCYYVTQFYFTTSGAYHTSDIRKKYDIRDIYTDEVTRLFNTDNAFIRHFKWKDTNHDAYGFIAQELAEYCPEAVDLNNDTGYYAVNYNVAFSKIIGAMYKEIKHLREEVKILKGEA